MDREIFAQRQAAMTANWYEGVKAREGDVEAYIAKRHAAYLDRWKEAGRFIATGSKVLDVGGGNLFPRLLDYFKELDLQYHYLDIDPAAVSSSRDTAITYGFDGKNFNQGFNDRFVYPSSYFDCVFSSHCIEHSIDLASTFAELNRILKKDGCLLMAVPFGWEENPEHPYFFSPEHWTTLLEDNGFRVRLAQIGSEYPEVGYDFFIAANKVSEPNPTQRIDIRLFTKNTFDFIPHDDPSITYSGDRQVSKEGNASHLRGEAWEIKITPKKHFKAILPIFVRHNWSGKITIEGGNNISHHDLYSWFHYVQPCLHMNFSTANPSIRIKNQAKNISSWSTEGVLYGYMLY